MLIPVCPLCRSVEDDENSYVPPATDSPHPSRENLAQRGTGAANAIDGRGLFHLQRSAGSCSKRWESLPAIHGERSGAALVAVR
jgi:hypothetical protein